LTSVTFFDKLRATETAANRVVADDDSYFSSIFLFDEREQPWADCPSSRFRQAWIRTV